MRIQLSPSGSIDDMAGEVSAVHISRTGASRYRVDLHSARRIQLELWASHMDRVVVAPSDDQPHWIALSVESAGELVSLSAPDCRFHLEQLETNAYFLGVTRGDKKWGLTLRATGYIKTRVMSGVAPSA